METITVNVRLGWAMKLEKIDSRAPTEGFTTVYGGIQERTTNLVSALLPCPVYGSSSQALLWDL